VVLSHTAAGLFCIKATSNFVVYESERRSDGAVLYPNGLTGIFEEPTAIEPRDSETIAYSKVTAHLGNMPTDFQTKLVEAVQFSHIMSDDNRQAIYEAIGVAPPPAI
jgi:hypothetical protein